MSNQQDANALEEMQKDFEEAAQLEKLKSETAKKKAVLDAKRVNNEIKRQEQDEKDLEAISGANYGTLSDDQILEYQNDHTDYIQAAKECMTFINEEFDNIVPFFRKNIILACAKSGDGKSTAVANIAFSVMSQKDPKTGKRRKTLILSNEENPSDVYARVMCLGKGWSYTNHSKFSEEQTKLFNKGIGHLAKEGGITVIADNYNGGHGVTTSPEGIKTVLDNLIKNEIWYDCIIIDYYQNVIYSKENSKANEWEAQAKLCRILDQYKNVYPAPIVVMAQMDPPTENNPKPYQHRLQGRKLIVTQSTLILEMSADRAKRTTNWTIHKSRFTEAVGKDVVTGFDNGKYVPYNEAFEAKVQKWRDAQEERELNKKISIPDAFNKEEDDVPE